MADEPSTTPPRDILRDHSYDGIQEYDNQLPRWWVGLFIITHIWALFYILYYHFDLFGGGRLGPERLAAAQAAVEERLLAKDTGPLSEAELQAESGDAARIGNGEELFIGTACNSCHERDAYGNVGPNLRDAYWLHDPSYSNMVDVIMYGRNENQMPSHEAKLARRQIQDIVFYLVDLNRETAKREDGSTAIGKAPQGERMQLPPPAGAAPSEEPAMDGPADAPADAGT
ncbi:MAG: cbb3-type cytochrome c oxidase N-terminal domain-containing protein [Planctomycetota bacterium]